MATNNQILTPVPVEKQSADFQYLRFYPAVGFHFTVTIGSSNADECDGRFQSVAGLSVELETESRKEGGENRFEHVLPVRTKYPLLVLKRGLIQSTGLRVWCQDTFNAMTNKADPEKQFITTKNLLITLLGPGKGARDKDNRQTTWETLMTWNVVRAWPKKWSISDLNAEQNAIAVETIEFQYQYFTVKDEINAH